MTAGTLSAQAERASLYYREGSSDKEYHVQIEPSGDGWAVTFAYGRRGTTLAIGRKTATPVGFDAARRIYDKLVREKMAKGYPPGEAGTPYQDTPKAERATGVVPQLLNPIDEEQAEKLLADPAWLCQEKLDGCRVLIKRVGEDIIGINRRGLVISLPQTVVGCALSIGPQQWIMDGECIGDVFHAFDLLERACVDLRSQPYKKRLTLLYSMSLAGPNLPIRFVRTTTKAADKKAMFAELKRQNREGIVLKRIDAPYTPGRPASGGDQVKHKFYSTASCIVAGSNGSRRSVKLELINGDQRVNVGSVTIPPNQDIPAAGQVIEVRYLYAFGGGCLYQPVFLGVRNDIDANACTVGQLKMKPVDAGDDDV